MLKSNFTFALRALWRQKGYSAVNVAGLSVAFCVSLFLFLQAYLQLTFDSFHRDGERIFQTYFFSNDPEGVNWDMELPLPLMPALKTEYPEVEAAARYLKTKQNLIEYKGKYLEKGVFYTDQDFLKIFSFPLLQGNQQSALSDLSNIVLSKSMAESLFGQEDPLGKRVLVGSRGSQKIYVVSGILADAPYNSSIHYDALVRLENAPNFKTDKDNWGAQSLSTFVKLAPGTDKATLEKRLKAFSKKYLPERVEGMQAKGAKPDGQGDLFAVRLLQFTDAHLGKRGSNPGAYVQLGLALIILLIASINFINLSIARSFTRAREVGVRKALGALQSQLFVQIWGESLIICAVGLVTGIILTYLLIPAFNASFNTRLALAHLAEPGFIGLMLGVFILITLLAGGYPAWQMAKFNPVEVLKGKVSLKQPGLFRNSLLVTQFIISSFFTTCTVIALQQLEYLQKRPTGFQQEQVISIPVGPHANGRQVLTRLRNKLAADPTVLSVTGSGVNMGKGKDRVTARSTTGFRYKGKEVSTDWLLVDYGYLQTLGIELLEGRDFDPAYATDSVDRVIVTKSMVKMLGEKNPVGSFMRDDSDTDRKGSEIIGVIADFNLYSANTEYLPITLHISHSEPINYVFVRVTAQSIPVVMDKLEAVWKEVAPQSAFMGSFLNENVANWYESEKNFSRMLSLASGIAIVLSCIGLFAVALLIMEQRTKEIGIRKVLGASIFSIIISLSKDFVKLVLISLVISLPLAWFLMQEWLSNFVHRIAVNAWAFVGVGLAAVLVAILTVSYQSIKSALADPVKSLRSE